MSKTPEPSPQGRPVIEPLDTKQAAAAFSEMLSEVDPRTGQPVADSGAALAPEVESPASAPADATPGSPVGELPELEQIRREHGEQGVAQVLEAVQQVQAHVAAERAKLSELIPDWRDPTTRALEIPEIIKFARSRGATDEQIAAFNLHGTAAELKNWRDFWRASHTGRRADELDELAPAPLTDAARTSRPASDARQHTRSDREARLQEAYERAAKTGRLRDAGDAFAAMFIEKP